MYVKKIVGLNRARFHYGNFNFFKFHAARPHPKNILYGIDGSTTTTTTTATT